jgi:hypothetical protein
MAVRGLADEKQANLSAVLLESLAVGAVRHELFS